MVKNMKVAVLFKDGFETIEALTVVDVFARAKIPCVMIGMDSLEVTSSHGIVVKMNELFDDCNKDFDMVILPGGLPGASHLQSDERVISLLKEMDWCYLCWTYFFTNRKCCFRKEIYMLSRF